MKLTPARMAAHGYQITLIGLIFFLQDAVLKYHASSGVIQGYTYIQGEGDKVIIT